MKAERMNDSKNCSIEATCKREVSVPFCCVQLNCLLLCPLHSWPIFTTLLAVFWPRACPLFGVEGRRGAGRTKGGGEWVGERQPPTMSCLFFVHANFFAQQPFFVTQYIGYLKAQSPRLSGYVLPPKKYRVRTKRFGDFEFSNSVFKMCLIDGGGVGAPPLVMFLVSAFFFSRSLAQKIFEKVYSQKT